MDLSNNTRDLTNQDALSRSEQIWHSSFYCHLMGHMFFGSCFPMVSLIPMIYYGFSPVFPMVSAWSKGSAVELGWSLAVMWPITGGWHRDDTLFSMFYMG